MSMYAGLEMFDCVIDEKAFSKAVTKSFSDLPIFSKNYTPKRILVNGRAVIVFWEDNTKTVVKLADGDTDDIYTAYCIALAKKLHKNNSQIKSIIKRTVEWAVDI